MNTDARIYDVLFSNDRGKLRQMYADAWQKRVKGTPMTALETQIADIIELHPEYQDLIAERDVDRDYTPEAGETNPYLHMGLHLGLREQVATDRPAGIALIFSQLLARSGDAHDVEHKMLDCLAETLWEAQRRESAPDELRYLERLRRLVD